MKLKDVKTVLYAREMKTSTGAPYAQKFDSLIRLCKEARAAQADMVVIASPEVLGDSYNEVIESLRCIADADLALTIVPADKARTL